MASGGKNDGLQTYPKTDTYDNNVTFFAAQFSKVGKLLGVPKVNDCCSIFPFLP